MLFPHVNDTAQYQQTFFPMYVEVKCEVRRLTERGVAERGVFEMSSLEGRLTEKASAQEIDLAPNRQS